jgi:adenosine deaminase
MRELAILPKAHLHLHLEGAMRPSTLADLAAAKGVPSPPIRGYRSFAEFGDFYLAAANLIQSWDDLGRVVNEVVEDAAADGAIWVEPQMYPARYERVGSTEDVLDFVIETGQAAAERHGIGFGLMVSAIRHFEPADATALAKTAVRYAGHGVVAFGLAADESLFPPELFAEAFTVARNAGLISAPHAGELAGPPSVRGALDTLGAQRIAHGVRAVEDPRLVERLVDEQIVLDVCPTSNLMLSVVTGLDEHPLPHLLAAGVRCTLNGDDPLFFGPGLLGEYELARRELALSDEQLALVARYSLEGSGAPDALVKWGIRQIDRWLTS